MATRVTRSEMSSFKVKLESSLCLLVGYSLFTRYHPPFRSIATK